MARLDQLPRIATRRTTGVALRNVVLACCRLALAAAERGDAASVHRARQALKRARAVLRLGQRMGLPDAGPTRRSLARCARQLSVGRDAVVVEALTRKLERALGRTPAADTPRRFAASPATFSPSFQRDLSGLRNQVRALEWKSCQPDRLAKALRSSWKPLRRQERAVPKSWARDPVHSWRKAAIELREQLWTLEPVLPQPYNRFRNQLHHLTRHLGRALDAELLLAKPVGWAESSGRGWLRRAARQQRALGFRRARKRWAKIQRAWPKLPAIDG